MSKNIAVVGSGSWGMALANHLAEMGNNVKVWSFTEEEKNLINNERKCMFIPDMVLDEKIYCSNDVVEVVKDADYIFHVTPSKVTRNVFKQYKDYVKDKPIVICSKGLENATLKTLDEVMLEELPTAKIAAFSGPSYATEVVKHIPTAIILASKHDDVLDEVSSLLMNEYMRIYKSRDVVGVEVGGALKNIIAFCAGICAELNFGTNAEAALITRGLAEITRLGEKMGADKNTFFGLSGLGDLILTCSSDESRNRRAGRLIGKGKTIEEAKKEIGMTIESVENIEVAKKLAEKYDVEMPIVNAAYDVLYNNLKPQDAVNKLMTRAIKFEKE
mgnify:FL=1